MSRSRPVRDASTAGFFVADLMLPTATSARLVDKGIPQAAIDEIVSRASILATQVKELRVPTVAEIVAALEMVKTQAAALRDTLSHLDWLTRPMIEQATLARLLRTPDWHADQARIEPLIARLESIERICNQLVIERHGTRRTPVTLPEMFAGVIAEVFAQHGVPFADGSAGYACQMLKALLVAACRNREDPRNAIRKQIGRQGKARTKIG